MREELSDSRKRELELQKKERELVASLSHDLKTPVTGIQLADIVKTCDDRHLAAMSGLPQVIIDIDAKRMTQVIGNIISNSYKYADTAIDISFRLSGGFLEMRIQDHGQGVPADEIELITNKFYRGRAWAESSTEGNGLGLYISKMLMKKMNGDLTAESDGSGLAITLAVPLS